MVGIGAGLQLPLFEQLAPGQPFADGVCVYVSLIVEENILGFSNHPVFSFVRLWLSRRLAIFNSSGTATMVLHESAVCTNHLLHRCCMARWVLPAARGHR